MFKVFSRQLLIRPDVSPYLMASNRYRLYAGVGTPLYWTNNAQVRVNTLDNKSLGTQAFSVSFAITREFVILSTGTRYILSYPGLMDVKAEDGTLWFKFNWEASPVWKYISSDELVPGWNSVALSSNGAGVITLVVNSEPHTLLDSNLPPTYKWFSGFSDSSYILLTNDILKHYGEGLTTGEISSYEHIIKIRLTKFGVSNQGIMDAGAKNANTGNWIHAIRWTITTDGFMHYRISTSGGETYPVDITGSEKLPLNTGILCKATYNKTTGYSVVHSVDGGDTWAVDGASSVTTPPYTLTANGWKPKLGDNAATGYSLQGSIDLAHTVFKCNGKEEFNGATAIESDTARENAYIISGTLTEETDKQEYPANITTGKLMLVQPWTVLKDVEAQFLGSVEPPTPVDPDPEPTPVPKKETMFLSHFESSTDALMDGYTSYMNADGQNSINITSSFAKFGSYSFKSGYNDWFKIITENKEPEEYTIEGWLFPLEKGTKFVIGSCAAVEGGVYNGFEIWTQANGTVRYNITNNAGAVDGGMEYLSEATPYNWHHFALVKSKQGIFGALNGKLVLVNADTTKLGWQKIINVGKAIRTSNVLPYPLDELRITKYNSLKDFDPDKLTYTVPTQAFEFEGDKEPDTPINPPAKIYSYHLEGSPDKPILYTIGRPQGVVNGSYDRKLAYHDPACTIPATTENTPELGWDVACDRLEIYDRNENGTSVCLDLVGYDTAYSTTSPRIYSSCWINIDRD